MKQTIRSIEAVIKITERCNLACTYCYMFYKGNDDYLSHPKYINHATVDQTAAFLRVAAVLHEVKFINIDLHGGEPLMLKRGDFDAVCDTFRSVLAPMTDVRIRLQTNATLVTPDWIATLSRNDVAVGVSLDGPEDLNVERIDHRGRSSYARTVAGIRLLHQASNLGLLPSGVGALCVVNPVFSGRRIYRHLVDDLEFESIDFLLPMESHESALPFGKGRVAKYYLEVFEEWTRDDNDQIHIRFFDRIMSHFAAAKRGAESAANGYRRADYRLFTIASNGDLGPDDDLKPINVAQGLANVATHSLDDFFAIPQIRGILIAQETLPTACTDCCWRTFCRGQGGNGRMITRYSKPRSFDNPSVFCADLKVIFSHLAGYLLNNGLPMNSLVAALEEPPQVTDNDDLATC